MSMYRCEICDTIKDSDRNVPEQYKLGLICESCQTLVGYYRERVKVELQKQAAKRERESD